MVSTTLVCGVDVNTIYVTRNNYTQQPADQMGVQAVG